MAKDKEREGFRQDLLNMSRFKIRRECIDQGCPVNEVREAEAEGEEAMIELLMQKYDAGEVEIPGMTKSKTKNTAKKTTRKAKREEPAPEPEEKEEAEVEPEEPEDPEDFNEDDLWGDDGDVDPEPEEEEPPKKSVTRKAAKKTEPEPAAEQSGLEDQMAQLMDLQVTIAENVDALSKTVLKLSKTVEEAQKYSVFVKVMLEMGTAAAFKFLKQSKLPNPLKHTMVIRQKAYEKSGLEEPKGDGSRKAKT